MTHEPRQPKAAAAPAVLSPRAEDAAAQAMWLYYRDHKAQLISDIRDYRAHILAQLMTGAAVEDVFAAYLKPTAPARSPRSNS